MEQTKRRRLSAQVWRGLLERQAGSGQTVEEFCRGEGIGSESFYRWRSKLGVKEKQRATAVAVSKAGTGFVAMGTVGESRRRLEVRLDLGDGLTLTVVR